MSCIWALLVLAIGIGLAALSPIWQNIVYYMCLLGKAKGHWQVLPYKEAPQSPVCRTRLRIVNRKLILIDMDETLVHCIKVHPDSDKVLFGVPADMTYCLDGRAHKYRVYKRPHVDYFLEKISKWYDIAIYTAASKIHADAVLDELDTGRNILRRRFYRHDCIKIIDMISKFIGIVHLDLANTILLDNSAYQCALNPYNSIRIKDFLGDPNDSVLQNMLIFLDCLRYVSDVRSVLGKSKFNENIADDLAEYVVDDEDD